MIIEGTVNQLRKLDNEGFDNECYSVSVEGFSVLAQVGKVSIPREGALIRANVQVHWRKGKPPVHWLRAVDVQMGGVLE